MARSSRITVKTYRNFALATIAFTLVVALLAKGTLDQGQVAPSARVAGNAAPQPTEAKIEANAAQSTASSNSPWAYGAPSAATSTMTTTKISTSPAPRGPVGDYEISTAVTGAYESAERAAAEGRTARMLASPAQVRAMVEESRRRSGEPTRDVPGANDDRSGELP